MKKYLLAILAVLISVTAGAAVKQPGFAIVIDPASYKEAKAEVDAYAASIKADGLVPFIVTDDTDNPDKLRARLKKMYEAKNNPIEGAVFIGDIPVVRVADAQHLASALKMDQRAFPRDQWAVASDRFYDDFGLQFRFIERDSINPQWYYYSLAPEGAQYLAPNIYTGRIKPMDNGTDKYEQIRHYLKKAVQAKKEANIVDNILYFSGHGYVSESVHARIDEKGELLQNFPWMHTRRQGIDYIDHKRDRYVKTRLMNELQRDNLDIAILHHHGGEELEYLNDEPDINTPMEAIDAVKDYASYVYRRHRGKGQPDDSVKIGISRNLGGIPLDWMTEKDTPEKIKQDSINNRKLNLYVEDFEGFDPDVRLVILDACYNGSFHRPRYLSGAYIFDDGKTVAAIANSVNVLQDKWANRYIGAVGMGMRAGNLVKLNPYLESHFIGDPTFRFNSPVGNVDVNALLAGNPAQWKEYLDSEYPALRAMALRQLADANLIDSDALLSAYMNDNSEVVRMEAMMLLSNLADENFIKCLDLAVDDSFELIQRFAVNFIGKCGNQELARALVSVGQRNNTGERIEFGVENSAAVYPCKLLLSTLDSIFVETDYMDSEVIKGYIAHALDVYADSERLTGTQQLCNSDSLTVKQQIQKIRTLRNSNMHYLVDDLLVFLQKPHDETVTVSLLEALGWFNKSFRRDDIAAVALAMSKDKKQSAAVRDEALKTYRRLKHL
ncbi:MAG: HEAT repeat domain-containing protein [Muribaculaceae bacterium]|nr:HEAT repeat domain-containing protein [Muribaculaceae bacterium]